MNRKGETVANPNDRRTRQEKQNALKVIHNENRWFNGFWKSEATKINEEKLSKFESTGNKRMIDIYRRKLGKV